LVTMATAAILNCFNPPKAAIDYCGYSYKVSRSLMIGIQNLFKSLLFCFHGNSDKVCPTDCVSFSLLLLHHPDCCRVMYCYSTFLFHYYYYYYYSYYSSTHFCLLYFSVMPWSKFMKPCRNIICHVKLCC
jgi:hypothetical protein